MSATRFIAVAAVANALLYHWPLFAFCARDLGFGGSGALTALTLLVALVGLTVLVLGLIGLVSHRLLKPFALFAALGSSVAVFFVATYRVVLDKTMMGNVLNTNAAESLELFHPLALAYVAGLGVLPCVLLARVTVVKAPRWRVAALGAGALLATVAWAWAASGTWLWIDRNSKRIGGMVMPWSYLINTPRYLVPTLLAPGAPEPLPPATLADAQPTLVVLVIGEAARPQNFQLYGYARETNPRLAQAGVVALKDAFACSTYTTASLRCILSHVDSGSELAKRWEPLPSYLQRAGVDVIWRSRNWGEPPMSVWKYQKAGELVARCTGPGCEFDEVLLAGLEQDVRESARPKVFVTLHVHGSHGPAYNTKVPPAFAKFTPVCESVDLSQCTQESLVNAYDNTILYADHVVAEAIALLRGMADVPSLLLYVSDHGESLGEYGLYLHGAPWTLAPDFQKRVPFLLWMSDAFARRAGVDRARLEAQPAHSHRDVFHTVLGALGVRSPAYDPRHDILSPEFGVP